jgi:choline-sulfatase
MGVEKAMKRRNLLFIMSDEHSRRVLGSYGHPMIETPNLDRLAARGVRFTDAYCNSPICVPSRASFHTGRYPHQIRLWDNAMPYDGSVPSWGHRLTEAGNHATSIGKLHFRSTSDSNGFFEEIMPLHVVDGVGDPLGMIRRPLPVRKATLKLANDAGCGDSDYQRYDDRITASAERWLHRHASNKTDKPWVLFVSFVCPHFPLIARSEWYDRYPEDKVPLPVLYDSAERPNHPYIAALRECQIYDKAFDGTKLRKAISAYFGLVSFTDHNVGRLLNVLEETRSRRRDSRDLHQRSWGQPRSTRSMGQVNHVRGIGRDSHDLGWPRGGGRRGLPGACFARRLLSDHSRMRWRIETTGRRRLTWHILFRDLAGCGTTPNGDERVSCCRRVNRRLHDSQGLLQVCALRRHAAAAFRPQY